MPARYLMLSSAIAGFPLPAIPALAQATLNQNFANQSSAAEGQKKSFDSSKVRNAWKPFSWLHNHLHSEMRRQITRLRQ
jgi:hypothetical protein